jgi:hypothetical protein
MADESGPEMMGSSLEFLILSVLSRDRLILNSDGQGWKRRIRMFRVSPQTL